MPLRLKAGDGFLLRVEELDPQNIRALWINYPHNPTGATAPYEYLEKVATFCRAARHPLLRRVLQRPLLQRSSALDPRDNP